MTNVKMTKKRRPQPAVVYTQVIPQKPGPEPPVSVAAPSSDTDRNTATETLKTKGHPEEDAIMYAQVQVRSSFHHNFGQSQLFPVFETFEENSVFNCFYSLNVVFVFRFLELFISTTNRSLSYLRIISCVQVDNNIRKCI